MKRFTIMSQLSLLIILTALILTGCEAIGTVFKTGVGIGVVIVIAIIAVVMFLVGKGKK